MEQLVAPPLPPKTRSPPASTPVQHSLQSSHSPSHVVKIRINPTEEVSCPPCIRISVNSSEMMSRPYFFYNVMSSGQTSPSDTLDSGTCSDLDGTPPPKKNTSVTLIQHQRTASLTDSDNDSCDSGKASPKPLPQTLLQDIRKSVVVKSYEERKEEQKEVKPILDTDMFYKFHLNEHVSEDNDVPKVVEDETFAGYKDLLGDGAATIRSAKGTVRGVKNRVRAGIATFLQINSVAKNYKEKDAGKVVVYTTTMGILRETYQACMKVKQILRTLLIKFEERDVFMSTEYQNEIRERMRCDQILVPQVFVDGQHVGDAETIERLNESGELRRILKPFKSMDACTTCKVCGGYRLLPCQVCNGSKKSVHRNHFTTEFVALKCMNCDEVGLVKCSAC
ncbi:glutaredoxin domain-containing cysteine-rich protein CG12206 [Tribolium castaneum]|uniref:Glutaredoxin domain-containing cysteine-rich protein CG31559-like Protein n=1 Tax=Tribolium castaneum TaxID=7070 RepID=D1ZZC1_TRICA|nr:PREDICTED: glutaredoxin domain-containing cysteine-rich protein CG12206 [Tribolium castaneum]XP_008192039.1 PREDICTED: glutaredoxin domain-containing cysteine-rich protein CG12206 [Tribolium castaneum]EFA01871.1 Glutaredoxin domain-containing cysteine-rich protein CG31559-like Protein [Tribolium castaneum]|eukprot:XP_008192036.1 PREDICTED: glutaredoxin domain-containing cysteine-rich protein CG12206 [Tribolium castaneum]